MLLGLFAAFRRGTGRVSDENCSQPGLSRESAARGGAAGKRGAVCTPSLG